MTPVSSSLASQLASPVLVLDAMGRMAFVHSGSTLAYDYVRDNHDAPVMFSTLENATDAYFKAIAAVSALGRIGAAS